MRRSPGLAAVLLLALPVAVAAAEIPDTLAVAARPSPLAAQRPVTGLSAAGGLLVAVGQRGHVLRSADGGSSWQQGAVPLSSDLTAVQMLDEKLGYATGHDGVVLGTRDGGQSWQRLLDGRAANRVVLDDLRAKVARASTADLERLLAEAERNVGQGADKPFLDLYFFDAQHGFIAGAYGLLLETRDGGKSWQSWFDRTDNPGLLNFYGLRPAGNSLYLAGEGGLLLRLDEKRGRFVALASPYKGSFFGVLGAQAGVLAYGMRGHAFLSADDGKSWQALATGLPASITAGAVEAGGRVCLVDQAGNIAISTDGGKTFAPMTDSRPSPLAAVALVRGKLVLGGFRGLRNIPIPERH